MNDTVAAAAAIRTGATSAADTVEAALARLDEVAELNAFTFVNADNARAQAAEVDAGTRTGPLAGVPITVKDHVWVRGLPATNGSLALRDFVAPDSCGCVDRLVEAGAIILAKTNNPEFCYRGVTDNELFGETCNPHDPTRTCGGSSGGAAVSVAAGVVPLAVGTDGGGSIRIPSAFCGTYGMKPTFGLVAKTPGFRGWPTLSVTGPIAASVRDLRLGLAVMAGPAGEDLLPRTRGGRHAGPQEDDRPSWVGLRVAMSADLGVGDIDPDVREAFETALGAISDAGAMIVNKPPAPIDPTSLWDAIAIPESWASEGPLIEGSPDLVGADAASLALPGRDVPAWAYLDAQEARADYARRWDEYFTEVDLLLTPTMPVTAFGLGRLAPETIDGRPVPAAFDAWCALALPANLAGLPAASVPIGPGRDGLPVGLQVMGPRWGDDTVLRGAALVDAASGSLRRDPRPLPEYRVPY
jgi:Asp-tRNA(Asn)/Glu-tRNA(Gln) amidotransferase A subunit family amidase